MQGNAYIVVRTITGTAVPPYIATTYCSPSFLLKLQSSEGVRPHQRYFLYYHQHYEDATKNQRERSSLPLVFANREKLSVRCFVPLSHKFIFFLGKGEAVITFPDSLPHRRFHELRRSTPGTLIVERSAVGTVR